LQWLAKWKARAVETAKSFYHRLSSDLLLRHWAGTVGAQKLSECLGLGSSLWYDEWGTVHKRPGKVIHIYKKRTKAKALGLRMMFIQSIDWRLRGGAQGAPGETRFPV
jgi:hypothetical protein